MSTEQVKRMEIWGRWISALSARNLHQAEKAADEMCADEYVVHSPKFPDFGRGPSCAKAFARYVIGNYSHINLKLEDFFGEGDMTAARTTVRITVSATALRMTYPVLNIMRWRGDKLAERWELTGPPEEQP